MYVTWANTGYTRRDRLTLEGKNYTTHRFSLGRGARSGLRACLRLRLCLCCGIRGRRTSDRRKVLIIRGLRYTRNEPKRTTVVGSSRRSRAIGRRRGPQCLDNPCLLVIPEYLGFVRVGLLEVGARFCCERRTDMCWVKKGGDAVVGGREVGYVKRDRYPRRRIRDKWKGHFRLRHDQLRPARVRFVQRQGIGVENEESSVATHWALKCPVSPRIKSSNR